MQQRGANTRFLEKAQAKRLLSAAVQPRADFIACGLVM